MTEESYPGNEMNSHSVTFENEDCRALTSHVNEDNGFIDEVTELSSCQGREEDTYRSKRSMKRYARRMAMREREKAKKQEKKNDTPNEMSESILKETECYIENGLRKVRPYWHTWHTYTKERWLGVPLATVLKEFHYDDSRAPISELIANQRITVNGTGVTVDYKLRHGDLVENLQHRHELPVTAQPIRVLADTEDVLVVDKPPSVPVHPCGRYRHNSLIYMLYRDHGYNNLRGFYRLDRLTSGVLIYAKNHATVQRYFKQTQSGQCRKVYLARVRGCFPEQVTCEQPMDKIIHSMGVMSVHPAGKSARTEFERLSYNGRSSVVRCTLHSGRTHQIRVHLQWLGHPILNDPIYNTPAWGPQCGMGGDYGKSREQLVKDIEDHHNRQQHVKGAQEADDSEHVAKRIKLDPSIVKLTEDPTITHKHNGSETLSSPSTDTPSPAFPLQHMSHPRSEGSGEIHRLNCVNEASTFNTSCLLQPNNGDPDVAVDVESNDALIDECRCDTSASENGLHESGNDAYLDKTNGGMEGCSENSTNLVSGMTIAVVKSTVDSDERVNSQSGATEASALEPDAEYDSAANSTASGSKCLAPAAAGATHLEPLAVELAAGATHCEPRAGRPVVDPLCAECHTQYADPTPDQLLMYLHAWTYSGPDWEYGTEMPDWAREDWTCD